MLGPALATSPTKRNSPPTMASQAVTLLSQQANGMSYLSIPRIRRYHTPVDLLRDYM